MTRLVEAVRALVTGDAAEQLGSHLRRYHSLRDALREHDEEAKRRPAEATCDVCTEPCSGDRVVCGGCMQIVNDTLKTTTLGLPREATAEEVIAALHTPGAVDDPRRLEAQKIPTLAQAAEPREGNCECCGRDYAVWVTTNALWNSVVRERTGAKGSEPFLCASCFAMQAEAHGTKPTAWVLVPETPGMLPVLIGDEPGRPEAQREKVGSDQWASAAASVESATREVTAATPPASVDARAHGGVATESDRPASLGPSGTRARGGAASPAGTTRTSDIEPTAHESRTPSLPGELERNGSKATRSHENDPEEVHQRASEEMFERRRSEAQSENARLFEQFNLGLETGAEVVDKQASIHRMRAQSFADDSDRADGEAQADDIEREEKAAEMLEYVASRIRAMVPAALRSAAATPVEAQPPRETCSCCQAIREVLTEAGIDASDTDIQPSVLVRRALAESRKAGWNAAIDEAAELFEDADWLDEPACPGESFPRCARMVRALRDPGRAAAKSEGGE